MTNDVKDQVQDPQVEATEAEDTQAAKPVPAAFADANERELIQRLHAEAREAGWTRPTILKHLPEGTTDSQVWRAQNGRTHFREVDMWKEFFRQVAAGEIQPPERKSRKQDPKELRTKLQKAADVIANVVATKGLNKAVREQLEALQDELPDPTPADAEAKDEVSAAA